MGDRLASGVLLADRYELQDLVTERLGSITWRAHDRILNRNVGLELLSSEDPRAEHFLQAARESTAVTDPRFLRVLDLIENEKGHHLVIREWARAFPLDQVLQQSPLPNRRAATVVAEVAEALAHAHEFGVYHRRLTPHQVLLKQSGAVRIVGLGVATALAPADHHDSAADLQAYERADVQGLGKLLYACLTSRWPGGSVDGLRAAPTEHGRLLRPRQVRAGVTRDVDTVCDRILGRPPRGHEQALTRATDIARVVRLTGEDDDLTDDQPSLVGLSSPDLLRLDPVIVPAGPPPGLEPPRRRPKAFEPAPPTTLERAVERGRQATKGDRILVLIGVLGALAVLAVLGFLVARSMDDDGHSDSIDASSPVRILPARAAYDFDPEGSDKEENPTAAELAIDGDINTGWPTTQYFGRPELGGLKSGVGLVIDLGGVREVSTVRIKLSGQPTDISVYVANESVGRRPRTLSGLSNVATIDGVGEDTTVSLAKHSLTRYVVVWLRSLPEVDDGTFMGQIDEVIIRGRS